MRYSLAFLALILAACSAPKSAPEMAIPDASLLDQVCSTEFERHGEAGMKSVDLYGNSAMDRYLAEPGDPGILEKHLLEKEGVCRGALLQLLARAHKPYLLKEWPRLEQLIEPNDKVALLRAVGIIPLENMDNIVLQMLGPDETIPTRRAAALAVASIDQAENWRALREVFRREKNADILNALILAVDLDKAPKLGEAMVGLKELPDNSVHRTVFIALASSELENKRGLLRSYLEHPVESVRNSAAAYLTSLEDKEKLELKVSVNGAAGQSVEEKLDPELVNALFRRKIYKVRSLVRGGANLNGRDESGNTILHLAARSMPESIIKELMLMGANPNLRNNNGRTPMHIAAMYGYSHVVRTLIANGADLTIADDAGQTAEDIANLTEHPLVLAAIQGKPGTEGEDSKAALLAAVKEGNYRDVLVLLQTGADPNVTDEDGRTPLILAAQANNLPMVERLIQVGASLYARDKQGLTAEAITLAEGFTSLNHYLKNRIKADGLRTAIIAASMEGNTEKVKELLDQGADVDTMDDKEYSLLMLAIIYGDKEMVEMLVLRKADYHYVHKGEDMEALARKLNKAEIADYLKIVKEEELRRKEE